MLEATASWENEAKDEAENGVVVLERVLCIWYLIWFKKNEVQPLFNLTNEVNAMTPAFVSKLGLKVCSTHVGAQKIDGSIL